MRVVRFFGGIGLKLKIHCAHHEELSISDLKKRFNPENNNTHNQDQIEQLAKILEYQGIRKPAYIRKDNGIIQSGHGRILAAEFLGLKKYPVEYQEYKDDDQAYADLTADNAIARQSDLDFSMINAKLQDLDPEFDLDWLGIKDFTVDVADKDENEELEQKSKESEKTCPSCGYLF